MEVKDGNPLVWTNSAQTARFHAAVEEQQRLQLAKRLKELRRYKGWTEADLWHASGVSIQTISRLENGHTTDPRENTLLSLAKAFKVSRDDLAGPRLSPEEVDEATQTQLDRIEAAVNEVLSRLRGDDGPPEPPGELGRRAKAPKPKPQDPGQSAKRAAADGSQGTG